MKLLILEQKREPENSLFKTIGVQLGIAVDTIDPIDLTIDVNKCQVYRGSEQLDLSRYHGVVVRTYRSFASVRFICHLFLRSAKPIFGLDPFHPSFTQDKVCDLLDLHLSGVPIPHTGINSVVTLFENQLAKTNWGFGGNGVEKKQDNKEYDFYNHHFQKYLDAASDWRILLIDGKPAPYLIERYASDDDFRTNKHQGGKFLIHDYKHPQYEAIAEIAALAAATLHRWCAGVDIRSDSAENHYVLEVNRTPRLRLEEHSSVLIRGYLLAWRTRMRS